MSPSKGIYLEGDKENAVETRGDEQAHHSMMSRGNDSILDESTGKDGLKFKNNKWDRNIINARDLIVAFLNGDGIDSVKVSTYNAMKIKAWSILEKMPDHNGVIKILNGQKITSFYRNIMGDDTCTVDGHAKNIYYGERHGLTSDKTNVGKKEYVIISNAYVQAGKKVRLNGRALKAFEIQAITWVTWRRIHNIT